MKSKTYSIFQIRLDNSELRKGTLTHKAVAGRKVHSGDLVLLNCSKATDSVLNKGSKLCDLQFTGFDPNSGCTRNSPCYGQIPSWSVIVDAAGMPDPQLLKLR